MLKHNVLRKNFEFQDVIRCKKQLVSKVLILYFRKNNDHLRIGISISKKFANAVKRNKYRRKVRHILDEINSWHIKKDVVLIMRKPFLEISYEKQKEATKRILERLENAK